MSKSDDKPDTTAADGEKPKTGPKPTAKDDDKPDQALIARTHIGETRIAPDCAV